MIALIAFVLLMTVAFVAFIFIDKIKMNIKIKVKK